MVKNQRTLSILGFDSWDQFHTFWTRKIDAWNAKYPNHFISGPEDLALDHIKPVSTFEPEELDMANHFTNLQPLPRSINSRKRDKWEWEDEKYWLQNIIYHPEYCDPYLPAAFEIGPE